MNDQIDMRYKRRWYAVIMCTIAFFFSYMDRQVLSLLIEPIQADLGISDTQFGLLQGFSFTLCFAVMGLPIASAADRHPRPLIIAAGVIVWSMATVACGFARGFGQLFLARMMIGAGEASLSPATYSMISDMFDRSGIGRATAVYSLGSFLGAGFAYLVGGAAIAALETIGPVSMLGTVLKPWQLVFVILGLPGILLGIVIYLTIAEPRRIESGRTSPAGAKETGVAAYLAAHRDVFVPHILGFSFYAMLLFGLLAWSPALLMRVYGFAPQEAGYWLGTIAVVMCGGGVLVSGWLLDGGVRRFGRPGPFRLGAIAALGTLPALVMLYLAQEPWQALAALAIAMFFASFPMPLSAFAIQTIVPSRLRARVSAVFLFFNSMIGLSLGAAMIGLLNDRLFTGAQGVQSSLPLVAGVAGLIAAMLLASGARPFSNRLSGSAPGDNL